MLEVLLIYVCAGLVVQAWLPLYLLRQHSGSYIIAHSQDSTLLLLLFACLISCLHNTQQLLSRRDKHGVRIALSSHILDRLQHTATATHTSTASHPTKTPSSNTAAPTAVHHQTASHPNTVPSQNAEVPTGHHHIRSQATRRLCANSSSPTVKSQVDALPLYGQLQLRLESARPEGVGSKLFSALVDIMVLTISLCCFRVTLLFVHTHPDMPPHDMLQGCVVPLGVAFFVTSVSVARLSELLFQYCTSTRVKLLRKSCRRDAEWEDMAEELASVT